VSELQPKTNNVQRGLALPWGNSGASRILWRKEFERRSPNLKRGRGCLLPPGGKKGVSKISARTRRVSFYSVFQRFADRAFEMLLGKVGVTHGHLQGAVTE